MLAAVNGTLEAITSDHAVVNTGGLSFRVYVPASTLGTIGQIGDSVRLHTHLHVREDILALYGFGSERELRLFEQLLTVSGVGPRAALNLISSAGVDTVVQAIASENIDLLTAVPGVGKKTAARIGLELRGKLASLGGIQSEPTHTAGGDLDVVAALTGLGYSASDAQTALRAMGVAEDASLENRLLQALRHLGQRGEPR